MTRLRPLPNSLIVGCWQLDDRSWKALSEAEIARAIDLYQAHGINCFDTADIYGRSETLLGRLLKGSDSFVLTKAVFFGEAPSEFQVRRKVENSLRNLQRDTLDVLQIHWHDPEVDFAGTFTALADLVDQGKIQRLGVTNFTTAMLEKALQYAPISTHQVQYSLIDRRVEAAMQALCVANDVALLPYGPLAGGFLSDQFRGTQAPKMEGDHGRSFYYSRMIRLHGGWLPVLRMLDTLAEVGQKHGKTISQVALNWVKQQSGVQAVISGLTLKRSQIQSNVEALQWTLDPEDIEILSARSKSLFEQPGDVYSYER